MAEKDTKKENTKKYIGKVGRRKTSVARVRLYEGKGVNVVVDSKNNPIEFTKVYAEKNAQQLGLTPLLVTETKDQYYFSAKVNGGGKKGQLGAIQLGLARALATVSEEYRKILREKGLLTRDPRMVERKKIYHVKARKSPQFSKR